MISFSLIVGSGGNILDLCSTQMFSASSKAAAQAAARAKALEREAGASPTGNIRASAADAAQAAKEAVKADVKDAGKVKANLGGKSDAQQPKKTSPNPAGGNLLAKVPTRDLTT